MEKDRNAKFDIVKFCISVFLHAGRPTSISLMRSRHHMLSFALLVMLNFIRSTVKHALQNMQNDCHQSFSHSFIVHQIRFRLGLRHGPRWGSLQRSTRPPSSFKGDLLLRGRRGGGQEGKKGRKEEKKKRERGGRGKGQPPNANSWLRSASWLLSSSTRLQSLCCTKSFFSMDVMLPYQYFSSTSSSRPTPWLSVQEIIDKFAVTGARRLKLKL